MQSPLLCHFTIGIPGCGKSTFAKLLAQLTQAQIVSTDSIRAQLYGDERIQGNWDEIEQRAIAQIREAIAAGQSVIYDATNAKRGWRMEMLMQLQQLEMSAKWVAWQFVTPLDTCKAWNQKRDRQVPEPVLDAMWRSLTQFPPIPAEGFAAVYPINAQAGFDAKDIQDKIYRLSRRTRKRTSQKPTLHQYSRLLDFDRLMHLISLILRYPGIGNLEATAPMVLEKIFDRLPHFNSAVEEICAIVAKLRGDIYADEKAIAAALQWLQDNQIVEVDDSCRNEGKEIKVESVENLEVIPHAYSDIEPFKRLLKIIRFIVHHPVLAKEGESSLSALAIALQQQGIISEEDFEVLREDRDRVLIPYQILREFASKTGYYAGTAIFSYSELQHIFDLLEFVVQQSSDPKAISVGIASLTALYETLQKRLQPSQHPSPPPVKSPPKLKDKN